MEMRGRGSGTSSLIFISESPSLSPRPQKSHLRGGVYSGVAWNRWSVQANRQTYTYIHIYTHRGIYFRCSWEKVNLVSKTTNVYFIFGKIWDIIAFYTNS